MKQNRKSVFVTFSHNLWHEQQHLISRLIRSFFNISFLLVFLFWTETNDIIFIQEQEVHCFGTNTGPGSKEEWLGFSY